MNKIILKNGLYDPQDFIGTKNIFVFGSNLAGKHGAGAALDALNHFGAMYGRGEGLYGNSYAIPTKDRKLNTLSLFEINNYVARFLIYASEATDLTFCVTEIGCGLAGYAPDQIAPMFQLARDLKNVQLPDRFQHIIDGDVEYDAELHNWYQSPNYPRSLEGTIMNDKKKRFSDGEKIFTSTIKYVKTMNTTYKLVK